jgi:hypothetical protein
MNQLLIAILIFVSSYANAQQADSTGAIQVSNIHAGYCLHSGNLNGISFIAIMDDGSIKIVGDTTKAVKLLYQRLIDDANRYERATAILRYLTIDGRVTDRKKYNQAVKEFMKLNK